MTESSAHSNQSVITGRTHCRHLLARPIATRQLFSARKIIFLRPIFLGTHRIVGYDWIRYNAPVTKTACHKNNTQLTIQQLYNYVF